MNRRLAPAIVAVAIAGFAFVPATANAAVCAPGQTEQNTYPPCTAGIGLVLLGGGIGGGIVVAARRRHHES